MLEADPSPQEPPEPLSNSPVSPASTPDADPRLAPNAAPPELWKDTSAADRELERMHHGTPIQCQFCVGQTFRRSRLRGADIRQLLLMRYPVRCTRCSQRQTVSFTVAGVSIPSYLRQRTAGSPRSSSTRSNPESPHYQPPQTRSSSTPTDQSSQDPASRA